MKYALVNNIKVQATKGVKGLCPSCGTELIAKCGDQKINHWAHKGTRSCDPWWEPETEWHRNWKNKFPDDWQEIAFISNKNGEKHIADVLTNHGLVIEFQHSHINPDERKSREEFYEKLIWVVDGTRLKLDYTRFLKGKETLEKVKEGIYKVEHPEVCFPKDWLVSRVPVIFDYLVNEVPIEDNENERKTLYCLFPMLIGRNVFMAEIPRRAFIKSIFEGEWSERIKKFMNEQTDVIIELQKQKQLEEIRKANELFRFYTERKLYRPRRRF